MTTEEPRGSGAVEDVLFDVLPALPYPDAVSGRSSGWSGSETSRERAERDDADGTTTERQDTVLRLLSSHGAAGLTWPELSAATGWHHGRASGALSNLHKDGRIACLSAKEERRKKCQPYVLPEHVNGRETRDYGRDKPGLTPDERHAADRLRARPDSYSHGGVMDADINRVLAALDRLDQRKGGTE